MSLCVSAAQWLYELSIRVTTNEYKDGHKRRRVGMREKEKKRVCNCNREKRMIVMSVLQVSISSSLREVRI